MVGWRAVTRVLRSCWDGAGGAARDLVNVVLPSDCRICGGAVLRLDGIQVCEECGERVQAQVDALCVRCGDVLGVESARMAEGWGAGYCSMCRMAPPEFVRAVAYARYENDVRELVHLLKFAGMRGVATSLMGRGMAAAVLKLEGEMASEVVVVPVPLFGARERKRGFNQARLLAEAGVARLRKERPGWKLRVCAGAMVRVKDTRPLFGLDPRQRREGLRGAFVVRDVEAVRGREVLLVDDIMTTGATARECSRVLLAAGAAKVFVATLAKAQPEGVVRASGVEDVAAWENAGSRQ